MPDPTSRIRFISVFPIEGVDHIVQNRPGSDLDGLVRVWPNVSGLEASWSAGIIWPGFWQDATGPLPVSDFLTWLRSSTDVPDNTVQNQLGSDLVLADCVRFWPNGSGPPEASQCGRIIRPASVWPMLPSPSGPDTNRIRHVYWGSIGRRINTSNTFSQAKDQNVCITV